MKGPERRYYIPKIRIPAEVIMIDGRVINGSAFVDGTMRLQDLLNDANPFFPFLDSEERVHLLNKAQVVSVQPL